MGPKKQADEKVVIRVSTSDQVSFTVSVDADKCSSTSYDAFLEKIQEGYAKTLNAYGQADIKPGTVEVVSLRNFHNIHLNKDEQATLDKICSLDPMPQSPTVGVVLRNDLRKTPDIVRWKFRGSQLDFVSNGGPQILQEHALPASSKKGIAVVTKAPAQTPENGKKRKAEQISTKPAASPTPAKLSAALKAKLEGLFKAGVCKKEDIDEIAVCKLASLSEDKGAEVLTKFGVIKIPEGENKSKHLMKLIREVQPAPAKNAAADKKKEEIEPTSKKARTDDAGKTPAKTPAKEAAVAASSPAKTKQTAAKTPSKPAATPEKEPATPEKKADEATKEAKPAANKQEKNDAKKNAKSDAKKEDKKEEKKPEAKPAKTDEKKDTKKVVSLVSFFFLNT